MVVTLTVPSSYGMEVLKIPYLASVIAQRANIFNVNIETTDYFSLIGTPVFIFFWFQIF